MITTLLAVAMLVQDAPQPSQGPLSADFPPERSLSPAHDLFYEDENKSTPEARIAIHGFGACVADGSTELASETLRSDFTNRSYRTSLRRLVRANESCFRQRGRLRSGGLLFAGAMAERLLKRNPQPLNVRLARAAMKPATPAYSPSDQIAICVVRGVPDETGQLLASDVGSEAEAAAVRALAPAIAACSASAAKLESNVGGLRAILATAAYRSIDSAAGSGLAQRD
jgi:hypothetical protein